MTQHVRHGVEKGCLVAASATPGMVVTIGADTLNANSIINNNVSASLSTTSVAIATADSAQDRYDLISADSAGVVTATTGALGFISNGTAYQPDTTDVKLGYVPVAAGVTAINAVDVQDVRTHVLIHSSPYRVSGTWYGPVGSNQGLNTGWASGDMYAAPYFVAKSVPLQAIGCKCGIAGTSGSKARLGIYADDGAGTLSLLLDAGQVALDAVASPTATASVTLTPGVWWFVLAFQSLGGTLPGVTLCRPDATSPIGASSIATITSASPNSAISYGGLFYTGITGALPASPTSPVYTKIQYPGIWVQAA